MTWGKSLFILLLLSQSAQASLGFGRFYSSGTARGEFYHLKGEFIELQTITAKGEEPSFRVSYRPIDCESESRPALSQCSYRYWESGAKGSVFFGTRKWNVLVCGKKKFIETRFARGRAVIYDSLTDFKDSITTSSTSYGTQLENGTPVPYISQVSGPDCVIHDFP